MEDTVEDTVDDTVEDTVENTVDDTVEDTVEDSMEKTAEDRQKDGGATWDIRKSCTKTRPPWLPISSRSKATRTIVNLDGEKMGAWSPWVTVIRIHF